MRDEAVHGCRHCAKDQKPTELHKDPQVNVPATPRVLACGEKTQSCLTHVGTEGIPHKQWVKQTSLELTNHHDGFLLGKTHLILDRDTKFCESFHAALKREGVTPVKTSVRSPNMNAHMERFFRSFKSELTSRMIFFGENALRRAVKAYLQHYHEERNHQGLENELIVPFDKPPDITKPIESQERLGGLLRFYHRAA